ncbi:hypothetical protein LEN26_008212 [Aphanomyces euteiches]|nr:hypothetical protein LEN26_008212 [Aphanomyces euteiches]
MQDQARGGGGDRVLERCNMAVVSTWHTDDLMSLVYQSSSSDTEMHVRLPYATALFRPRHQPDSPPCQLTVDFGMTHTVLHMDMMISAQCVDIFVGRRTANGKLRFSPVDTAFGMAGKHSPERVFIECPTSEAFQAISAVSFKFSELIDDVDSFCLEDLRLVLVRPKQRLPVAPPPTPQSVREARGQSMQAPMSNRKGVPTNPPNYPSRKPSFHSSHPADNQTIHDRHSPSNQSNKPIEMLSSRSMPVVLSAPPSMEAPERAATAPSLTESDEPMAAMISIVNMQKKMLEDMEKRISLSVEVNVNAILERVQKSEDVLLDLDSRLDGIQQDKDIVFSGILHRLNKLETNFGELKKAQDDATKAVQVALDKVQEGLTRWKF